MILGTMSGAGKSLIVTGLCRIFAQDGYRTAPFKSQNMALNSFITRDGLEMGRAQVVQAQAAKTEPDADMNPILLKPSSDSESQVIVHGKVRKNESAREYFSHKRDLIPDILESYHRLESRYDIIVIEGAGSPAEMNLKADDIVNLGLAELVDAPCLLCGDIDRGGVFAQLIGTVDLLEPAERARIKGLIVNKFRGDRTLFDSGVRILEEKSGIPVTGVVPYTDVHLPEEDSISSRFEKRRNTALSHKKMIHTADTTSEKGDGASTLDIAVIHVPHISNYTDFAVLEEKADVRYVTDVYELGTPDIVFLPGSKNTIDDMQWLVKRGLADEIIRLSQNGHTLIFGICGGYQMLGMTIEDPYGVETDDCRSMSGLGLLPMHTTLTRQKIRRQTVTRFSNDLPGVFHRLSGLQVHGYEIHMGISRLDTSAAGALPLLSSDINAVNTNDDENQPDDSASDGLLRGNVCGTYLHGIFDEAGIADIFLHAAELSLGKYAIEESPSMPEENSSMSEDSSSMTGDISSTGKESYEEFLETQYDRLADVLRESLDMEQIYHIMGLK